MRILLLVHTMAEADRKIRSVGGLPSQYTVISENQTPDEVLRKIAGHEFKPENVKVVGDPKFSWSVSQAISSRIRG